MKKIYTLVLILLSMASQAQPADDKMVQYLRSDNKMYAVIAVLLIIFAGIVYYLIRTDRRISKLEKKK